jgi:two-component system sensor histidine kinase KdpD
LGASAGPEGTLLAFEGCSSSARYAVGAIIVVTVTAFDWLAFGHRRPVDVVMLYLLGVVFAAMRLGYGPSLLVAAASVASYDFFFVTPYFRMNVYDPREVLTFAIMLLVAVVMSSLTQRIRQQAASAQSREALANKLYAMSRELVAAGSIDAVVVAAERHLRDVFDADVSVVLPLADGRLTPPLAADCAVFPPEAARSVPLLAPMGAVGVLRVSPHRAHAFDKAEARKLLDTFASPVALALERGNLAAQAQRAQTQVQTEKLRNALLSSVSHDLRTPLAVVQGAATELLDRGVAHTVERRREFLQTIASETRRLNRLVHNLLDMTALEAGVLSAKKEWQPIDEVIGVALGRLEEHLGDRPVEAEIPDGLAPVAIDATLIEQVLVNLIENADKYAPKGTTIAVAVRQAGKDMEVLVADRGPGIAQGEEERIFDKFHRAIGHGQGMGLGLTICRGIVTAHGGTIRAENRPGGGAIVVFTLPLLDPSYVGSIQKPDVIGRPEHPVPVGASLQCRQHNQSHEPVARRTPR